ncbi:MAG: N-acetylmuramoyl-L-alanine amidase, partial [Acidobacteriaceae bacterium]|nr:N-acetylmuramoyl-L-alanine amidase [Acidobacteriaceae bacterium]
QFKPRQTRVVLELAASSDYHASFVTDPPRLVIEVRNAAQSKETQAGAASNPGGDVVPEKHGSGASQPEVAHVTTRAPGTPVVEHDSSVSSAANVPVESPTLEQPTDHITSFVTSDGVKKTIVEPDDTVETNKSVAAKPRTPEPKPVVQGASDSATAKQVSSKENHTIAAGPDGREAQPTAAGDRSLIRALGLKIGKIVIDPGHGGHDTGTIGPHGLEEKDLVLDVSRRLGNLLATRLGAEVIYTRSDDTFIPLETRTAIANQEAADLFVSVHANSSHDPDARGIETYYLNFTSSPDALEVAARENAVSEESIHELQDLVKKIALKEKIEESREFAVDVERSLHSGLTTRNSGVRDRGVKKAPFIVLIGANMPSILAEISFVSNPTDERRLKTNDYRQRIAESLYRGIAHYVNGLSGVKVASKIEKAGTE